MTRRESYSAPKSSVDSTIIQTVGDFVTTELQELLLSCPGAQVLDIGCGAQPFKAFISELGGGYSGSDVQQNTQNTVDWVFALDTQEPIAESRRERYAIILCTEVLEHISDWPQAFRNLNQLLKPNGKLILTTPFVYPLHEEPSDYLRATPYYFRVLAQLNSLQIDKQERGGSHGDVLSLALGLATFEARNAGFMAVFQRKLASLLARGLKALLNSSASTIGVNAAGPLYLSNLLVLTKLPKSTALL